MANLAASNVAYTLQSSGLQGLPPRYRNLVQVVFGNGVLTYPTNGVPLTAAKLGLPVGAIESLVIAEDATSGLKWSYDSTHGSLRAYRAAGATPAGTVAAPTFTGAAHTLAGTVAAPTLTAATAAGGDVTDVLAVKTGAIAKVSGAAGITGIQAPAFTGESYTPAGTNSAPAFTGTAISAAALVELTGGTTAVASNTTLVLSVIGY